VMRAALRSLLAPRPGALALFAVLAFICVGGAIQTYAFIDFPGVPKPPLYDALRSLSLWPAWVLLAAPAHLLGYALGLRHLLRLFPTIGCVKLPVVSVAYSYLLSCWATRSWSRYLRGTKLGGAAVVAGLAAGSILAGPARALAPGTLEGSPRALSALVFMSLVTATYSVSLCGLAAAARSLLPSLARREQLDETGRVASGG